MPNLDPDGPCRLCQPDRRVCCDRIGYEKSGRCVRQAPLLEPLPSCTSGALREDRMLAHSIYLSRCVALSCASVRYATTCNHTACMISNAARQAAGQDMHAPIRASSRCRTCTHTSPETLKKPFMAGCLRSQRDKRSSSTCYSSRRRHANAGGLQKLTVEQLYVYVVCIRLRDPIRFAMGVTRRKPQTLGTSKEHRRQETPSINPNDLQSAQLTDQAPGTIERAAQVSKRITPTSTATCTPPAQQPPAIITHTQ